MNNIEFYFEDITKFPLNQKHIKKYINTLINNELKITGEISIILCSDEYLLKMNKEYLNHDYYTDIITFDYVEDNLISGDLFISIYRVKEDSENIGNEFNRELYRVVFHGILHLVGYKDKLKAEKALMTKKENYYLSEVDFRGEKI